MANFEEAVQGSLCFPASQGLQSNYKINDIFCGPIISYKRVTSPNVVSVWCQGNGSIWHLTLKYIIYGSILYICSSRQPICMFSDPIQTFIDGKFHSWRVQASHYYD